MGRIKKKWFDRVRISALTKKLRKLRERESNLNEAVLSICEEVWFIDVNNNKSQLLEGSFTVTKKLGTKRCI